MVEKGEGLNNFGIKNCKQIDAQDFDEYYNIY